MNMKLSITKEEINSLPLYKYKGEIVLIEKEDDALKAIREIKNENVLGFDTETKASFRKGEKYSVSLLQLATDKKAYLFRLNKLSINEGLIEILENPKIFKLGVAVAGDVKALKELSFFKDAGFIDLAELAKEKKIENLSLRALTAIFLEKRLSKKAKISNWERNELKLSQIRYAASDAAVGYSIYEKMSEL